MELRLQPVAVNCPSAEDGFAILAPIRVRTAEREDYIKVYTIVWRCNKSEKCKSSSCHYAGRVSSKRAVNPKGEAKPHIQIPK